MTGDEYVYNIVQKYAVAIGPQSTAEITAMAFKSAGKWVRWRLS